MVRRYHTGPENEGQRLDLFLRDQSGDISRSKIRRIIDIGGVHVDGRRVRKSGLLLSATQLIEMYLDNGPLDPYRIEAGQVLFQDDFLIVLNKPAGVETQPTPARYQGTLYAALQVWLGRDRRFGRRLEIGMAQRLDRDTSGVIIFSIHPRAHKSLTSQLQSRSVKKSYLALVEGRPEPAKGSYESQLIRDRRTNNMKSTPSGGKEAITRYRVLRTLEEPEEISLVELELVTGRTHQIRAHLSEAGHPLLGDVRYGGCPRIGEHRFSRQCLHSQRLELTHPIDNTSLIFEARMPVDMDPDLIFSMSGNQ